jgi:hypothetical protein
MLCYQCEIGKNPLVVSHRETFDLEQFLKASTIAFCGAVRREFFPINKL